MCTKPIILQQWYDRQGDFHSCYFADFDPSRHNQLYLSKLKFIHNFVGMRKLNFVVVPCGKCQDCARVKARDWKVRLYHHSITEGDGLFVTLTYNDEHLEDNNLNYEHYQLFMKRLRKLFPEREISFFCAGEYGFDSLRRHFHAIIFGLNIDDVKTEYFSRSRKDRNVKIWLSRVLEKCWCTDFSSRTGLDYNPDNLRGFVSVSGIKSGDPRAFGYVSGYIICKMSDQHKRDVMFNKSVPEFHHMSLKRPIGKNYYVKYCKEIFNQDFVWFNMRKLPIPKAYDRWYQKSTERAVIRRIFMDKSNFDFLFNGSVSSFTLAGYVFCYHKPSDFAIDKVSDFDIIKSRRKLRLASSTGRTFYNYDSRDIKLSSVYDGFNSGRDLYLQCS